MTKRTTDGKRHIARMFKDTSEITQNKIHALRLILLQKKKKKLYSRKIDCTLASLKVCSLKRITHRHDPEKKEIKALCSDKFEKC